MGADSKVYSHDEVSLHNTAKDCWVIINAKAYDVTNFLDEHPGGGDVLLESAGKDASEEFEAAGHGSAARLMLDEYYVGEIDPSTNPTPMAAPAPAPAPAPASAFIPPKLIDDDNKRKSCMMIIVKLLPFLLPLLILGLALSIRNYTSSSSNSMHSRSQ